MAYEFPPLITELPADMDTLGSTYPEGTALMERTIVEADSVLIHWRCPHCRSGGTHLARWGNTRIKCLHCFRTLDVVVPEAVRALLVQIPEDDE